MIPKGCRLKPAVRTTPNPAGLDLCLHWGSNNGDRTVQPHPHIDAEKWRAVAMRLRVWLCEVMLWLAEWFGDHRIGREVRADLRADLRAAQRGLRGAIVMIALARVSWAAPPGPRTFRPGAVIRTRSSADMRHVTRIIRFRARSLRGRVQRLHDVVDALDAHVARMLKRLEAGFRQLGPVLVVALAVRFSQTCDERAPRDSS